MSTSITKIISQRVNMRIFAQFITEHHPEADIATARRLTKGLYNIKVYKPTIGTTVYNFLEDVYYTTSDKKPFVLIGTRGEEWVVNPATLNKYCLPDGSDIDANSIGTTPITITTKQVPDTYYGIQVKYPTEFEQAAWGDILHGNREKNSRGDIVPHEEGDWLICMAAPTGEPNLNDMWIVNGSIVKDTYVDFHIY